MFHHEHHHVGVVGTGLAADEDQLAMRIQREGLVVLADQAVVRVALALQQGGRVQPAHPGNAGRAELR